MTALRWPTRTIQGSISDCLKSAMTTLGWFDPSKGWLAETETINWDPDHDVETAVAGQTPPKLNTVGISIGSIPDYVVQELGAGLQAVDIPVFIDIYGESRAIALNIADDLVAVLQGEQVKLSRYIPLYDHSVTPHTLITTMACEARLVESVWPSGGDTAEWKRGWRAIHFTATVYWVGAGND